MNTGDQYQLLRRAVCPVSKERQVDVCSVHGYQISNAVQPRGRCVLVGRARDMRVLDLQCYEKEKAATECVSRHRLVVHTGRVPGGKV